jgi:hypothetical protein
MVSLSSSHRREGSEEIQVGRQLMGAVMLLCASSERHHNLFPISSHEYVSPSVAHFVFDNGCFSTFNTKARGIKYGGNHEEYAFGGDDSSFL